MCQENLPQKFLMLHYKNFLKQPVDSLRKHPTVCTLKFFEFRALKSWFVVYTTVELFCLDPFIMLIKSLHFIPNLQFSVLSSGLPPRRPARSVPLWKPCSPHSHEQLSSAIHRLCS